MYEFNGWMSLYQMEVYVNDHVQISHVVQITKTPEPEIMTGINLAVLGNALCSVT